MPLNYIETTFVTFLLRSCVTHFTGAGKSTSNPQFWKNTTYDTLLSTKLDKLFTTSLIVHIVLKVSSGVPWGLSINIPIDLQKEQALYDALLIEYLSCWKI